MSCQKRKARPRRPRERGKGAKRRSARPPENRREGKGKEREGEKEQKERETRLDGRNNRFCYCARWAPIPDTTT